MTHTTFNATEADAAPQLQLTQSGTTGGSSQGAYFQYTSTTTQTVNIAGNLEGLDTAFSIWQKNGDGSYSLIEEIDNNFSTGPDSGSFLATAGVTYVIKVGVYGSGTGNYTLTSSAASEGSVGTLAINDVTQAEGNSGTTAFTFTVTRTGSTTGAASATYTVANGTTDAADFAGGTLATGTVSFAAGETSKTITVNVAGDNLVEANETFFVNLTNPVGATISDGQGLGTITNDDAAGSVSIANTQIVEGNDGTSQMVFTLTRTGGNAAFSVNASTVNLANGATAGSDYGATAQTISFAAGQNTATFSVPIYGDTTPEGNENFQVNLSNATNGATIVQGGGSGAGTATGTIINDDSSGVSISSSLSVTEGNQPVNATQIAVTRDPAFSQSAATFYARSSSGTATSGSDFNAIATPVYFAPGQSVAYIPVNIIGDQIIEPNETFTITLYQNANYTGVINTSTVTIVNDDGNVANNAFGPGNDVLYAVSAGGETLAGGNGDDQYLVNSIDDVIIEGPNGGYDTVFTASSYTLNGGSFVESLSTQTHSGTDNINLIGNFASQLIIGNYGNNVLNGNGGVDTLIGLYGDDIYVVGDASAQIIEKAGEGFDVAYASTSYKLAAGVSVEVLSTQTATATDAINLSGNEFAQVVIGNAGANVLDGGSGADTLMGLGGADTFAFTTALGNGNVDVIQDFQAGTDKIGLSSGIFTGLGASFDAAELQTGTTATGSGAVILYDSATGNLFYDADGAGSGTAVLFAQVTPGTALTAADFAIIPPPTTPTP